MLDDDVVESQGVVTGRRRTTQDGSPVDPVISGEEGFEFRLGILFGKAGHETQFPKVDAENRNLLSNRWGDYPEEGAVTPDHATGIHLIEETIGYRVVWSGSGLEAFRNRLAAQFSGDRLSARFGSVNDECNRFQRVHFEKYLVKTEVMAIVNPRRLITLGQRRCVAGRESIRGCRLCRGGCMPGRPARGKREGR